MVVLFCFLSDFTGIDSPYEVPQQAHLSVRTGEISIEEGTQKLVDLLVDHVRLFISFLFCAFWFFHL